MDAGILNISDSNSPKADEIRIVEFSRDVSVATGTQAITGVGFKPSLVYFYAVINNAIGRCSLGFDNGTTALSSIDNTASPSGVNEWGKGSTSSIVSNHGSGNQYAGNISTLDTDGFTLSWTKVGSPTGTLALYAMCYK